MVALISQILGCLFVAAAIGYRFSDTVSAVAGYRALGVDYSNDGFLFDVVQQGPTFQALSMPLVLTN